MIVHMLTFSISSDGDQIGEARANKGTLQNGGNRRSTHEKL